MLPSIIDDDGYAHVVKSHGLQSLAAGAIFIQLRVRVG